MTGRLAYGVKIGATLVVLVVLTLATIAWMVGSGNDDPAPPAGAPAAPAARTPSPDPPPPTWTRSPTGPQVVVPNVMGRNAASAAKELRSLGFGRVLCLTADDDETEPTARWTVTGQTVAAGTRMAAVEGPFYLNCA